MKSMLNKSEKKKKVPRKHCLHEEYSSCDFIEAVHEDNKISDVLPKANAKHFV